jgi:signal transduction histidine kinase
VTAPSPAPPRLPGFAATILLSLAGVCLVAAVQMGVVVGVPLRPALFVAPLVVGVVFGTLLALVRRSRARERLAQGALVAREAEVTRLNDELERRVGQRTAELEQRTEALLVAQRMEVLGRLAGGVAHDFNNILTAVVGCAEALREELAALPEGRRAAAAGVLDELDGSAERARQLTRQLVTLGRSTTLRREAVDLAALVARMAPMLRRLLGETVQLQLPAPGLSATVRADPSQLEQLVLNLAVNARDAMPRGGVLAISAERTGAEVYLSVADTGVGMDQATRARIFEPFFTTKGAGRGTGLGLAVVAEVARRAAARVDVTTQLGRGTRFLITFPAIDEAAARPDGPMLTPVPRRPLRLLLVEDDPSVRLRLVGALRGAGHQVLEAADPVEAERLVRADRPALDALVCDVVLPRLGGPALVARLRALGVSAPVVFMSGYSAEEIDERVGGLDGATLLQKPFAPAVLLERLEQVLAPRPAR